jgi:hypothetical protein
MLKFLAITFFGVFAFAQDVAPVAVDDTGAFLSEVFKVVMSLGGLSWGAKIAAVCTLLISGLKISALRNWYDKLGAAKVFLGPLLALVAGLAALPQLSGPAIMAYLLAGGGSIILHQVLDAMKALPWLGVKLKVVIWALQKWLGGKPSEKQVAEMAKLKG